MKKVVLDLTDCKCLSEIHERIKKSLDFPDYYGKNLDALWDCINRDCDVNFVEIKGSKTISDELKPIFEKIIKIFEKNKQHWLNSDSSFDYKIID